VKKHTASEYCTTGVPPVRRIVHFCSIWSILALYVLFELPASFTFLIFRDSVIVAIFDQEAGSAAVAPPELTIWVFQNCSCDILMTY